MTEITHHPALQFTRLIAAPATIGRRKRTLRPNSKSKEYLE